MPLLGQSDQAFLLEASAAVDEAGVDPDRPLIHYRSRHDARRATGCKSPMTITAEMPPPAGDRSRSSLRPEPGQLGGGIESAGRRRGALQGGPSPVTGMLVEAKEHAPPAPQPRAGRASALRAGSACSLRHLARRGARGGGHLLRRPAGRDRGARRRVRLRQVGLRARASCGCLPRPPRRIVAGSVLFEGRDLLELSEDEMRAVRGKRHLDDLPGADDVAEPGADDRLPDHRAAVHPSGDQQGRPRAGARSSC